jgi:transcriptional regulator with XRE-family HTH domain
MQFLDIRRVEQAQLGQRIRAARENAGLSQEEFAEAVRKDQRAISEYENGKRKIPATDLATFAHVLGVRITYFYEQDTTADDLDQLVLHQFHTLPTPEAKHAAIQVLRLFSDTLNQHLATS